VVDLLPGEDERAESIWPGGVSAVRGSPFSSNQLPGWLTNDAMPLLFSEAAIVGSGSPIQRFTP
jgi:hypothetical protein